MKRKKRKYKNKLCAGWLCHKRAVSGSRYCAFHKELYGI